MQLNQEEEKNNKKSMHFSIYYSKSICMSIRSGDAKSLRRGLAKLPYSAPNLKKLSAPSQYIERQYFYYNLPYLLNIG